VKSKPAVMDQFEVEHALHVLTEAEKHRKNPKMMEHVAKLAAEKKEQLGRVARMKPKAAKPASRKK
jgi:hypothetical protein